MNPITLLKRTEGEQCIRASQMVKTTREEVRLNDLCIIDELGDQDAIYAEAREKDGMITYGIPKLFPCVAWGVSRSVSYSICLNRATCVSVAFDVVVVPTSWWHHAVNCDGQQWVIQIVDAHAIPKKIKVKHYYCYAGDVVGWAGS